MSYQLKLKHLIAGDWVGGSDSFESSPSSGPKHSFPAGTDDLVETMPRQCVTRHPWPQRRTARQQAYIDGQMVHQGRPRQGNMMSTRG